MVYASFAGQGGALAVAFACHVRDRWGWLLRERTGEILARAPTRARWWPEEHLASIAQAVAVMAVAVALVCGYWAAGGSFGVSDAQPDKPWALHVSGVVGLSSPWPGCLAWPGDGGVSRRSGYRWR